MASVPITKAVRTLLSAWYEHVVAGAIGAEHVVVAHQAPPPAPADQAHHGHCQQGGTQRQVGTVGGDVTQRRTDAASGAARSDAPRSPARSAHATSRPPRCARRAPAASTSPTHARVAGSVRCAPAMLAAAGSRAPSLPSTFQRLLGQADVGQRLRVAGLAHRHLARESDQVEKAIRCEVRVEGLRAGRARRRWVRAHAGSARCRATVTSAANIASTIARGEAPPGRAAPSTQLARRLVVDGGCASRTRRAPSQHQRTAPTSVQSRTNLRHGLLGLSSGQPHARIGPGVGQVDDRRSWRCTAARRGRPSSARWRNPAPPIASITKAHRGPGCRRSSRTPGCRGTRRAGRSRRW